MRRWIREASAETTPRSCATQGGIPLDFISAFTRLLVTFASRRPTVTAFVGSVPVGSGHPVVVQSMTNTDTADAAGTAAQCVDLA